MRDTLMDRMGTDALGGGGGIYMGGYIYGGGGTEIHCSLTCIVSLVRHEGTPGQGHSPGPLHIIHYKTIGNILE